MLSKCCTRMHDDQCPTLKSLFCRKLHFIAEDAHGIKFRSIVGKLNKTGHKSKNIKLSKTSNKKVKIKN